MKSRIPFFFALLIALGCAESEGPDTYAQILDNAPSIEGRKEYLDSPFLAAGNRLYMVGHQNGSFPELGWHVKGEMGGVWLHPIKLMDGFDVEIETNDNTYDLSRASSFVNYPSANMHSYADLVPGLELERWNFVPDGKEGMTVQFLIKNTSDDKKDLRFKLTAHADLMPVWLGERTQMEDGQDSADFNTDAGAWVVKDGSSPWYLVYGLDIPIEDSAEEANELLGKGTSNSLSTSISVEAGSQQTISLVIAGSTESETNALDTFKDLQSNDNQYLIEKSKRLADIASRSKLTIEDKDLQQTFEWLKYNCDWLVRTVPGLGTGIAAGIPDYPWFFGVDSEYALRGYMAIGQSDVVHKTIRLIDSVSNAVNGNGRIIHEMSTNGAVFNEGNINETPQFASLIWETYLWNGDREFLEKYFPTIEKGLIWLMEENDSDGNLFPDGFGMMEIHGLDSEMIDVAAYTQRAFDDASKIAAVLGKDARAEEYSKMAATLKDKINAEFWSEEFASYADFIGTDQQTLHLIDDAIVRADTLQKPWAITELEETRKTILANPSRQARPFVLHHNWVVNTPMEMKIADEEKAVKALETAEKFVNPFGVFVTGIDRDESAGSDEGSFQGSKVFSYTGAVMTLPTGVQAIAENNYGRPDKALDYLKRMTRTFSYALPGSMYEVSPDYGMMAQAWNIYSFAIPIVQQFFGIQPNAAEKKIVVSPLMPSEWKDASLENVLIKDNAVSVFYKETEQAITVEIVQNQGDWEIELRLPAIDGKDYRLVDGNAERQSEDSFVIFRGSGERLVVESEK